MLINYLIIGAIVKQTRDNLKELSKEEKLQHIEREMIKKGFSQKDYKECMSFILTLLNEDSEQNMMPFMHEENVEKGMEDNV